MQNTLPSLKVPPVFLSTKAIFKENDRKMGGTFKEGTVDLFQKVNEQGPIVPLKRP